VQQHFGTIDVESKPGRTSFNIRLPLAAGKDNEQEA
jgi:nitrogen-specific signal transduction histidine kinase